MKYRSMENRFCMSLVAFAVIVRLLLATGVSAALSFRYNTELKIMKV